MRAFICGMVIALALLAGCSGGNVPTRPPIQLGVLDRAQLPAVFQATYDTTHIDMDFIELIKRAGSGVAVKVFLGTWCPDSHREVPRFLKIVDVTGPSIGPVTLYGLDRTMKSPGGEEGPYGIEKVPTFIFFKNGGEIGRIVETPQVSMEGDILTILASAMNQ
jgi:thiol-disulfide isomerase/thioredoxin